MVVSKLALALGIQGEHPTTEPTDNLVLVATSLGGSTAVRASIRGVELR